MIYVEPNDIQRSTTNLIGISLYAVQLTERSLGRALALFTAEQNPHSFEDFFRLNDAHRKATLGRLVLKLRDGFNLETGFLDRLERFLSDRNRFIHRLFFEEDFDLLTDEGCIATDIFLADLLGQASYVHDILQRATMDSMQSRGIVIPDELIENLSHLSLLPSPFHDVHKPTL